MWKNPDNSDVNYLCPLQPHHGCFLLLCKECTLDHSSICQGGDGEGWFFLGKVFDGRVLFLKVNELDEEKMKTEEALHDFLPVSVVRSMKVKFKIMLRPIVWSMGRGNTFGQILSNHQTLKV